MTLEQLENNSYRDPYALEALLALDTTREACSTGQYRIDLPQTLLEWM